MLKVNLKDIAGFLAIVFCGFYLKTVLISPIYISAILSVIFILLSFFRMKQLTVNIDDTILLAVGWIIYLVITQSIYQKNSAFYNLLFSIMYYILSMQITNYLSQKKIICYSKYMLDFSILLLMAEAILRITNPVIKATEIAPNAFYRFKYNSIMYQDSNYVGVFILVLFFLIVYLEAEHAICLRKEKMCYLILGILTFSRSIIIVILLFDLLFNKKINKFYKSIAVFFASIFGIYWGLSYVLNDGSFISKIDIIKWAWNFYVETAQIYTQLFGYGLGHSIYYIGIGSHNVFVTYILETGIIGFMFFVIFLQRIFEHTRMKAYYIILPFLIAGFSFTSHFNPFLYCVFSIIISLEKIKTKKYIEEGN